MKRFIAVILSTALVLVAFLSSACAGGGSGSGGSVGDVNINNLLVRQIVEKQVRQRVSRLEGSLWNTQNNYWASSEVNADGWADLIIKDPIPGAYTSYIGGQEYNEILGRNITRLEARSEVLIGKGKNVFTPELTLSEWQDVVIKLPAKYTGSEENFDVSFMIGGGKNGTSFQLSADRQYIHGMISLSATSDVSILFDGRKYAIPLAFFFGSIGENNPLPLNAFNSEVLTTVAMKVTVMENYIAVPTEVTTIAAAMQYATAGMTVLVKNGSYNESFTLKPGVRLYGNPSCTECVVIESDQPWTVKSSGAGQYEIVGVTIRNTYAGAQSSDTEAAVSFGQGADVRMRHSVVDSRGNGHGMVTNTAKLQLANITFKGSGIGTALMRFNNSRSDYLNNLLFYNWADCVAQTTYYSQTVKNSLFWQARFDVGDGSNVSGDPQFLQNYNSGLRPNIDSPAIQQIMNQSGNYPGALRPEKNYDGRG